MLKCKRIAALALIALLLLPLFPASALAAADRAPGEARMPKIAYSFADGTGISGTPGNMIFQARVMFAFRTEPAEIARAFQEDQPLLCLWTYVGDSFFYRETALAELPLITKGGSSYVQVAYLLEEAEGVFAELLFGDGSPITDEAWNFGDWRPLRFDDVPHSAWYYSSVNYAANILGLLSGTGNRRFAPDESISYAEALALAVRMYERSISPHATYSVTPGSGADWYRPYLDFARTIGLPWDYPDYHAAITRAELAQLFYAALHHLPDVYHKEINKVADGSIPDVPMRHKYAEAIYTLYRAGILSGSGEGRSFLPDTTIRRSEAAALLSRSFGEGRQEFSLGNFN